MAQPPDSGSKHNEKKQSFKNKLLDKDLIDDLLATGCGCGKACFKKFSFKNILQWRELLASLCRPDQDLFLWNMAKDGLPGQWVFLGQPVCRPAMCSLTMSGRRLKKFRTAHHKGLLQPPQDMRRVPYPRKSPAKEDVLEYLRWMHNSMAEAMPNMPNDVADSTTNDLFFGTSLMWLLPEMIALRAKPGVVPCHLVMCAYGCDYMKRTTFLTNAHWMMAAACKCRCGGKHRTRLQGNVWDPVSQKYVKRTSLAAAYPKKLCERFMSLHAAHVATSQRS